MLEIKYSKDGKPYSDFAILQDAQSIIDNYISGVSSTVAISTGNIIQALRVLVVRGKLPHSDICFIYNSITISLSAKAEFTVNPKGFLDWEMCLIRELLESRIGRKLI